MVCRMSQGWVVMPLPSVAAYRGPRPLCSVTSLPGQIRLVCCGPVGLRDDDVRVLEKSSRAQAVVVHGLSVGLEVTFHVLWIKGEVRADHGGEGGGGSVWEVRRRGHGESWRQRWRQKPSPSRPGQGRHGERRQRLGVDPVPCGPAGAGVPCRVPWSSIHAEEGFVGQAWMDDAAVGPASSPRAATPAHTPLAPLLAGASVALLDLRVDGGAVAAVADGAAGHPAGHRAEHAAGAAQVVVGREDFRGRRRRKAEVGPCAGGDGRGALRNAAPWRGESSSVKFSAVIRLRGPREHAALPEEPMSMKG